MDVTHKKQLVVSLLLSTKHGQYRLAEPIESHCDAPAILETLRKRAHGLKMGIPRNALKMITTDCTIRFKGGSASAMVTLRD